MKKQLQNLKQNLNKKKIQKKRTNYNNNVNIIIKFSFYLSPMMIIIEIITFSISIVIF